jgi:hypothetical protein
VRTDLEKALKGAPHALSIAIVLHDRIRDKDKDPSFSAKQIRANDEGVWAAIRQCPLLAHGCVAGIAQIVQELDEEPTYR